MKINCELDYCLYNEKFTCTLKEAQLNSLGMCDEFIIVSIPKDVLKELKERQLAQIESRWKDSE